MSKNLTEKQEKFVEILPEVGDLKEAAERAGYSATTPSDVKSDILSSNKVRNALLERLAVEGFAGKLKLLDLEETAIGGLQEILESDDASYQIKMSAINSVLDRNENLKRIFGLDIEGQVNHEHGVNEADRVLLERMEELKGDN